MAADSTYTTGNFEKQGGNEWDVGNGAANPGSLIINAGGTLDASAGTVVLPAGGTALPKISFAGIKTLKGIGAAAPGAVTLTGAAVGDRVVSIIGNLTAGGPLLVFVPGTDFEATISIVNQIQQLSATDLHLTTIVVTLVPAAA